MKNSFQIGDIVECTAAFSKDGKYGPVAGKQYIIKSISQSGDYVGVEVKGLCPVVYTDLNIARGLNPNWITDSFKLVSRTELLNILYG